MEFNQDIFTLRAQINYMKECLLQKEGTLEKIKNVFGSHQELEVIKAGITKKIEDLVKQAPLEYVNDINALQSQWDEVQTKLQDEKEVSESLQEATRKLKDRMRQIYQKRFIDQGSDFVFISDIKRDMRVNNAVQPHFHKTTQKAVNGFEDKYPEHVEKLFNLSLQIDEGVFGEKTKDLYEFSTEFASDSNSEPMVNFLQLIDPLSLTEEERQAAHELFLTYLHELSSPTYQKVHLLISKNLVEKAVNVALNLKNPVDKSKALTFCIERLTADGDFDQPLKLLNEVTQKSDTLHCYTFIIGKLTEAGHLDKAIQIAQGLKDDDEVKTHIIKEIAIKLINLRRVQEAIKAAKMIKDPESCSYIQSTLVNLLMQMGLLKDAKSLARAIKDNGAREDAYAYIVKGLLQTKQIEEALKFASSIRNSTIKTNIAKIIESVMIAQHQNEKVQKVRKQFSLSRPFPHAAA